MRNGRRYEQDEAAHERLEFAEYQRFKFGQRLIRKEFGFAQRLVPEDDEQDDAEAGEQRPLGEPDETGFRRLEFAQRLAPEDDEQDDAEANEQRPLGEEKQRYARVTSIAVGAGAPAGE